MTLGCVCVGLSRDSWLAARAAQAGAKRGGVQAESSGSQGGRRCVQFLVARGVHRELSATADAAHGDTRQPSMQALKRKIAPARHNTHLQVPRVVWVHTHDLAVDLVGALRAKGAGVLWVVYAARAGTVLPLVGALVARAVAVGHIAAAGGDGRAVMRGGRRAREDWRACTLVADVSIVCACEPQPIIRTARRRGPRPGLSCRELRTECLHTLMKAQGRRAQDPALIMRR